MHHFFLPSENQANTKICKPAFLLPFPIPDQTYNTTSYQSAISKTFFNLIFFLIVYGTFYLFSPSFCHLKMYHLGTVLYVIIWYTYAHVKY